MALLRPLVQQQQQQGDQVQPLALELPQPGHGLMLALQPPLQPPTTPLGARAPPSPPLSAAPPRCPPAELLPAQEAWSPSSGFPSIFVLACCARQARGGGRPSFPQPSPQSLTVHCSFQCTLLAPVLLSLVVISQSAAAIARAQDGSGGGGV